MDVFIGTVSAFGFNFAPYGWAQCQGQILPISAYTALFSLLGTAYGGNGTSNFGLPNLQNRVAIGQGSNGQSSYNMGEEGGNTSVTITTSTMPTHNHSISLSIKANNTTKDSLNPVNGFPGLEVASGTKSYATAPSSGTFMGNPSVVLGNAGGGPTPVSIIDPNQVLNYSIALYGIFPTRP